MDLKIRIINNSSHSLPAYKTEGAAGMDLAALLDNQVTLEPLGRALIPTGIHIALPPGFEAQVRSRSGLARKGIIIPLGTIDSDYRGEIKVLVINLSNEFFGIKNGDRIAQLIIARYVSTSWEEVEQLDETARGINGFGSTGIS